MRLVVLLILCCVGCKSEAKVAPQPSCDVGAVGVWLVERQLGESQTSSGSRTTEVYAAHQNVFEDHLVRTIKAWCSAQDQHETADCFERKHWAEQACAGTFRSLLASNIDDAECARMLEAEAAPLLAIEDLGRRTKASPDLDAFERAEATHRARLASRDVGDLCRQLAPLPVACLVDLDAPACSRVRDRLRSFRTE